MSDEALPAEFPVPLAGRDIMFRRPTLGQILVLQRVYERARKLGNEGDEGKAMTSAIVRTLDFIDTLVVVEDDRQFIEDQMMAGTIDWEEVLTVLAGGKKADQVADDEDPKPAKRAPRKSPKAAPVATRGRAKR